LALGLTFPKRTSAMAFPVSFPPYHYDVVRIGNGMRAFDLPLGLNL
jgi:hypothetical protein